MMAKKSKDKIVEELTCDLQRERADFENFRKRVEGEKNALRKEANASLVLELLPVLDNFSRALEHIPASDKEKPWVQGILYIQKDYSNVLKNIGINEIEAKPGDKFDPAIHEAIEGQGEKIKKVILQGYKLNGKLLRPVKVVVGK